MKKAIWICLAIILLDVLSWNVYVYECYASNPIHSTTKKRAYYTQNYTTIRTHAHMHTHTHTHTHTHAQKFRSVIFSKYLFLKEFCVVSFSVTQLKFRAFLKIYLCLPIKIFKTAQIFKSTLCISLKQVLCYLNKCTY